MMIFAFNSRIPQMTKDYNNDPPLDLILLRLFSLVMDPHPSAPLIYHL